MKHGRHVEMISTVARGLGDLKNEVVFVGGATIGFHITDPAAPEIRLSEDVDCVVDITSRSGYYKLEEALRRRGFKEPPGEGHPICRYEYAGVMVDIMPADESVLGFLNRWVRAGIANARTVALPGGLDVAIFSVPYLLASKLEAFKGRGRGDYLGSADMEDVIALVDGCESLTDEIARAPADVKHDLGGSVRALLEDGRFIEALRAHIVSARRADRVERAIRTLEAMAGPM